MKNLEANSSLNMTLRANKSKQVIFHSSMEWVQGVMHIFAREIEKNFKAYGFFVIFFGFLNYNCHKRYHDITDFLPIHVYF
jgi:hypothetical protein